MRPVRKIIFAIIGVLFPFFVAAQTVSEEPFAKLVSEYLQYVKQRLSVTEEFSQNDFLKVIESNPYWKLEKIYDPRREYRYFKGRRLDSMRELYVKFKADKVEFCYQFYKIPSCYIEHMYPFFQRKEFELKEYHILYCSDERILMYDVSRSYNIAEKDYRIYELLPITQREMQVWEKQYKADQREQRKRQREIARIKRQKAKMPPQPIKIYGYSVLSDDEWKAIIREQCYNDDKREK